MITNNRSKIIYYILVIFLFLAARDINSQTLYVLTGSRSIYRLNQDNSFSLLTTLNIDLYDIAISETGDFYGISSSGIVYIDINNGTYTVMPNTWSIGGGTSLTYGAAGNLYTISSRSLYKYNINTNVSEIVSNFNLTTPGDLSIYKGNVIFSNFVSSQNGNPAYSRIMAYNISSGSIDEVFCLGNIHNTWGLANSFNTCEKNVVTIVENISVIRDNFYNLNLDNGIITKLNIDISSLDGPIYGLASDNEYLAANCNTQLQSTDCNKIDTDNDGVEDRLDLDDDNDGILDTVEQNGNPNRDSDADGYPDHRDLDSDNDGCFDVIECGFTDNDQNGTLGQLPDTVDANGLIIGEPDGYTTPIDSNLDGVFDFQQNNLLDPGENGTLEICVNSSSVDLFDRLNGSPDTGGVWTPSLSSGTGVFDPSIDLAGVYTYTVTNGVCGMDSSQVNVTVNKLPNAGEDGSLELCIDNIPVNLFDNLNGTPDTGGVWAPSLSSGTGIFDPLIDAAGVYTYTVTNGACETDTSKVDVKVNEIPNAGEDGSVDVCINNNPVNLFDSLNGTPDTGGVWTPNLSSGTGMFDPLLDAAGIYTYTIDNRLCGTDTSQVTVSIIEVEPITDYNINIVELNDNNSVEITINSNLNYEYSIDGINYQTSNIFRNLGGGDYTIYVREINGCGILEEMISVLGYPKYFTPNGDSIHDYWQIKGIQVYPNSIIRIYDRYGKLLKEIGSNSIGWDGTYNGRLMPSSEYWFSIHINNKLYTGHFSLIR